MEQFNNKSEANTNDNLEEKELSLEEKYKILEAENSELKDIIEVNELLINDTIHSAKNRINSALGFANLTQLGLEEDSPYDKEKVKDFMKIAVSSIERTTELLNDFLDLNRINSRKIEKLKINLRESLEEVIAPLKFNANKKEIDLKNNIDENTYLIADSKMLGSVIENLVSNAIKFTNSGGDISVHNEKKGNSIEIYFTDNGVGLSEETKNKLFKEVVSSSLGTDNELGTGLGLMLCKKMIEKMDGTIRVESEEGKGTTFVVTLPSAEKEVQK